MNKLLTVAALATVLCSSVAHADILSYMAKTSPTDKAVMAAILVIYDEKCDGTMSDNFEALKGLLITERAFSEKQAKKAIGNQAALIFSIGLKSWCLMAGQKISD